jgi:hypothetical protein
MFLYEHNVVLTTDAKGTHLFQSGHQAVSGLAMPQTDRSVATVHRIDRHWHRIRTRWITMCEVIFQLWFMDKFSMREQVLRGFWAL